MAGRGVSEPPSPHRAAADRDSFSIATATHNDQLIGFAYGITLPPDTGWWSGLPDDVPDDITTESPGGTFALIDFAVHEDWRGKGIGRQLHDRLLASRHEERAIPARP
jgi:GNAT superfamily N-acetyltransferase